MTLARNEGVRRVVLRYRPFAPHQTRLHRSQAKEKVAVTGARGGKTTCGSFEAIDKGVRQPGFSEGDIRSGKPYTMVVGAPTYPMVQRVVVPAVVRALPDELRIGNYLESKRLLRMRGLHGESHIYFMSGKAPESWQGLKLYFVWFDEFPLLKEAMYDEAQTRLSDQKGSMLLTGTPQGPNWAKTRLYDRWQKEGEASGISFNTWRTVDNPNIDRQHIEQLRQRMPRKYFKRTFEASWDVFEGQVWDEFLDAAHVRDRSLYTFLLPDGKTRVGKGPVVVRLDRVVAGVDWGYSTGHAGVILVCGMGQGRWWILEESVAEGVVVFSGRDDHDSWVNRGKRLRDRWQIEVFYCDYEAPESLQQFRKGGLNAREALKFVREGIECVAKYIHLPEDLVILPGAPPPEANFIILSDCVKTIEEIRYYHWKEGAVREQPVKERDNTCDSLRYALYTFEKRGSFKREAGYGHSSTTASRLG